MDYWVYKIQLEEEWKEIVLAFLTNLPFDTFEETDSGISAYVRQQDDVEISDELKKLQERFSFKFEREAIPAQNWNEVWESNFQAIEVGQFCGIRADFHSPFENVQYELVVNPKMAFGTGHHATTYMMIQLMEQLDWNGKKVLDYGTGTGILAILASKLGAKIIDAVDIEEQAYENTLENAERNNVHNIHALLGGLSVVQPTNYQLVLANINRNVILASLPSLYQKMTPDGIILFSGILSADEKLLLNHTQKEGFFLQKRIQKEDWIALQMKRI